MGSVSLPDRRPPKEQKYPNFMCCFEASHLVSLLTALALGCEAASPLLDGVHVLVRRDLR